MCGPNMENLDCMAKLVDHENEVKIKWHMAGWHALTMINKWTKYGQPRLYINEETDLTRKSNISVSPSGTKFSDFCHRWDNKIGVNNSEKALEKSAKCFDIINTDVVYLRKEKCYMYAYKWCFEEKNLI